MIARTFDRVCAVLDELGYLDGDTVTADGQRLSRLYSELDLVAAECIRRGLWDGLNPAELAACVSVLSFESRKQPDDAEPTRLPKGPVRDVLTEMGRTWAELDQLERRNGVSFLREPDSGFVWAAYRWVRGVKLEDVLDSVPGLTPGDFVRSVKQLIDLLDQIAAAASYDAKGNAAAGRRHGPLPPKILIFPRPRGPRAGRPRRRHGRLLRKILLYPGRRPPMTPTDQRNADPLWQRTAAGSNGGVNGGRDAGDPAAPATEPRTPGYPAASPRRVSATSPRPPAPRSTQCAAASSPTPPWPQTPERNPLAPATAVRPETPHPPQSPHPAQPLSAPAVHPAKFTHPAQPPSAPAILPSPPSPLRTIHPSGRTPPRHPPGPSRRLGVLDGV